MALRDAARELAAQRRPVFVRDALPEKPKTAMRQIEIALRFGVSGLLREPPNLAEIQQRLIKQLSERNEAEVVPKDLRYGPQCIWHGDNPIAHQPELLERLLRLVQDIGRRSLIRTLAAVYFRDFRRNRPGLELVGRRLSGLVAEHLAPLHQFDEEFIVFNPAEGPRRIARYCLQRNTSPQNMLRGYGLNGDALTSGFGFYVFLEGMINMAERLNRQPSSSLVERAVWWTDEPKPAQYRAGPKTLANTLLLPFTRRGGEPSEELRNRILDILLGRLGDPRTNAFRWQNLEKAAEVARRWLSRLALLQFLEIVDQVAYPRHWNYRRAFWTALYEKDAISQAWVAFGPLGVERAKRDYGRNINFGRLSPSWKQVESGHAVLIMQIGDFVAVDWSQNGRCVFWPISDPNAPRLYEAKYYSGDLAPRVAPEGGIEVTHVSSEYYAWQRKIARFIRDKTGFDLLDRHYLVS